MQMRLFGMFLMLVGVALGASSETQDGNDISFLQASWVVQQPADAFEAAPISLAEKAPYHVTEYGASACHPGYERITSDWECQGAAEVLGGQSYRNSGSWNGVPTGCISPISGNGIQYNGIADSAVHNSYALVCRQASQACEPDAGQDKNTQCSSDLRFDTLDECKCAVSRLCAERPSVDSKYEGSNFWDDFCNREVTVRDTWLSPGCGIEVLPDGQSVRPYFNTRTTGTGVNSLCTPICKAAASRPSCAPNNGLNHDFVDRVQNCGFYSDCGLTTFFANTDYDSTDLEAGQNYVAQWDMLDGTCKETIVRFDDHWGKLGEGDDEGDYGCMGRCGRGCYIETQINSGGAADCLKHDVCGAYARYLNLDRNGGGCNDPHCGDEQAQTVYNDGRESWGASFLPGGASACSQHVGRSAGNGIFTPLW